MREVQRDSMQGSNSAWNSSGKLRLPPVPPPKPSFFGYDYGAARQHQNIDPRGAVPSSLISSVPPLGDSDTDSGICADSEHSASSPHQAPGAAPEPALSGNTVCQPSHHSHPFPANPPQAAYRKALFYRTAATRDEAYPAERDYLTPNSARRLFGESGCSQVHSPRRLPARPTRPTSSARPNGASAISHGVTGGSTGNVSAASTIARNGKPFRVRFADQIGSPTSSPSTSSSPTVTSLAALQLPPSPAHSTSQHQNHYPNDFPGVRYSQQQNGYSSCSSQSGNHEDATMGERRQNGEIGYSRGGDAGYSGAGRDPCGGGSGSGYLSGGSGYSVDDVESLPPPPSYSVALQRISSAESAKDYFRYDDEEYSDHGLGLRESGWGALPPKESVRDSIIRQSIAENLANRQYRMNSRRHEQENSIQMSRNRSSSLPRRQRRSEGDIWNYPMDHGAVRDQLAAASMENLQISPPLEDYVEEEDERRGGRRRLPPLPGHQRGPLPPDEEALTYRRPAYSRQRRCRAEMSKRSASVGRYPSMERLRSPHSQNAVNFPLPYASSNYPLLRGEGERCVRAHLIALDHRGLRTVLIEKVQPGPFGFYIATGVINGQRGIFISRVSIASLCPILSIGDEIIFVDDELVKGRSLEYVQSLIAGKTAVTVTLLPTVGPALC